jgi:hypothetical protein
MIDLPDPSGVAGLMVTQTGGVFTLGRKQADVNG